MGTLYSNDLNKYKHWFSESAKLLGIDIEYRYIIKRESETATAESIYSKYSEPIIQSVIVEQGNPMIDSLKQLGWFVDTTEEELLIDFSVDTPNLQEGCRVKFISNEYKNQNKEYSIIRLSNQQLYPSCIKCLCIPVLENESIKLNNNEIQYGQQDITADEENYTYINEKPKITVF